MPSQGVAQAHRKYLEPSGSDGLCHETSHWYGQTAPIPVHPYSFHVPSMCFQVPIVPRRTLLGQSPRQLGRKKPIVTWQKTVRSSHWPRVSSPLGWVGLVCVLTYHAVKASCSVTCVEMRDERVSPHTLDNVWHHTSRCDVSRDCMCPCQFCVTGCLPDVPFVCVFVGWCVPEFQLRAWYMLAVPCV